MSSNTPMPPPHGGIILPPGHHHMPIKRLSGPYGPETATDAAEIEAQMTLGPSGGCQSHRGRPCHPVGSPPHTGMSAPFQNPVATTYFAPPIMPRTQYDMAVQDRWCNEDGSRCVQQRYNNPCHGCK